MQSPPLVSSFKQSIAVFLALSLVLSVVTVLVVHIREVPKLSTVKKSFRSRNLTVLDRNGRVIDEIRKGKEIRRLNWITLDEAPKPFVDAVLQSEKWRLSADSITMQLAKGKFWSAIALEMVWSRKQILEAYINLSVYRGELQGLAAASQALFDRPPDKLSRAQGAVLAALIQSSRHSPEPSVISARGKACALLESLDAGHECGLLSRKHLASVEKSYRLSPFVKMAPHVAQLLGSLPDLREENVVHSTLDRELQWVALHALQKQKVDEGAVVVLENSTGNVLVYVSYFNDEDGESYQDLARDLRQAGSALKPFLFAKALDDRIITPVTNLSGRQEFVTMARALTEPLNLPVIQALEWVGAETFVGTLANLGFHPLERPEFYGPSLALGSADVHLLHLTNAYRVLANNGIWSAPRFSPQQATEMEPRKVFSPGAAFIVAQKLYDSSYQQNWAAMHCEQWCLGFTEKFTIGVLGGNQNVWREIMTALHNKTSSQSPQAPSELVEVDGEWFFEGTEPLQDESATSHFSYPRDGAIIEIESKKEPSRFFIQVVQPKADQNVYLNDRRLGRAQPLLHWKPESGAFRLELRDAKGRTLHKVHFEVRGQAFAGG